MCCGGGDNSEKHETKSRGLTDILWLIIFTVFCFGIITIAAFAIVYGNPWRLIYGYDSFGNVCGHSNDRMGNLSYSGMDLTNKKYVFYFNIAKPQTALRICVSECPSRLLETASDLAKYAIDTGSRLCRYDIPVSRYTDSDPLTGQSNITARTIEDFGACPSLPVYPSTALLNRCIPKSSLNVAKDIINDIYGFINSFDLFQQILADVYATWKELVILTAVACILSALMVLILHFLVNLVFWIVFIGISLACCAGTGFLWWTFIDIEKQLNSTPAEELLEDMVRNERAFLCFAIFSSIFTVIVLAVLLCFKKEMPKVQMLFKEAASCMFDLPCLFFQPVWTMAVLFCFILFWVYIILSLATASLPSKHEVILENTNETHSTITEIDYVTQSPIRYMWWYYIVALLWVSEVILSSQQMIMAGTIAKWYFAEDRNDLRCPLWNMTINVLFCHLGSVAKGSFLITLCKLPRIILSYINQKLESSESTKCTRCCKGCCCCFLWTFEKFLRYMNHNAYTVVAVTGDNFCHSAKEACAVMINQAALVATVNSAGDFVLFLGKCLVTIITGVIGLLFMKLNMTLNFYAIPVLISCVIAYYVAHCVLSLFEMIIDTLTLCYCEQSSKAPEGLRILFKARDYPSDDLELEEFVR